MSTKVRTCRGRPLAVVSLNRLELHAIKRLLDSYIVTETFDPDLPIYRRLLRDLSLAAELGVQDG